MPLTRAHTAPGRGSFSKRAQEAPPRRRRAWIAISDLPPERQSRAMPASRKKESPAASLPLLFREFSHGFLRLAHVVERQLAGLHQVRHYRLYPPAKKTEQVVDQSALRRVPRDRGLENMRVADFLHALQHLLAFHAVDRRLDGRIRRPVALREKFLNLANRRRAAIPERFHDLKLQLRQFRQGHARSLLPSSVSLLCPFVLCQAKL